MTENQSTLHWEGQDGYERIESARREGWQPVPSWGMNGYDLGDWPYVVVYHRGRLDLAVDVEGDVTFHRCTTEAERERRTDEIAFTSWQDAEDSWVAGIPSLAELPAELRGPFTRRRLAEHQAGRESAAGTGDANRT